LTIGGRLWRNDVSVTWKRGEGDMDEEHWALRSVGDERSRDLVGVPVAGGETRHALVGRMVVDEGGRRQDPI